MAEPNIIVRSKRQHIEEGTAGSYFGPLPNHYGMCMYIYYALRCIEIHLRHVVIHLYCIEFNILESNNDPRSKMHCDALSLIHCIVINLYCVEFNALIDPIFYIQILLHYVSVHV